MISRYRSNECNIARFCLILYGLAARDVEPCDACFSYLLSRPKHKRELRKKAWLEPHERGNTALVLGYSKEDAATFIFEELGRTKGGRESQKTCFFSWYRRAGEPQHHPRRRESAVSALPIV